MRKTIRIFPALFALALAIILPQGIKDSKHNLSSGGLGDIKTDETSMICIFCHTSHHSASTAPLWNREESNVIYSLYDSSTLYSNPDQPDGASKLCLSCHDGTIALGRVLYPSGEYTMQNTIGGRIPPGEQSNLGADLSDDHPISFDPSPAVGASPELVHPSPSDDVNYDAAGKIQCTSCHDPHDNAFSSFLAKSNYNAGLCKTCHRLTDFDMSSIHDLSAKSWNGRDEDPWPHTDFTSVAANSCMNCHRGHLAAGGERLLNAPEEGVCLVCHNGNVGKDVEAQLTKASAHRVSFYQGHDPAEDILSAPVHVECTDCHNSHRITNRQGMAPNVKGNQEGVSGMTISGAIVETAQYEYEVCLKCHGQNQYIVTTPISRMFATQNTRMAFLPGNVSYHAVAATGTSSWVPSLIPPYTTSSWLFCTDCHSTDSTTGPGARGPHGSNNDYLLERRYVTMDYTPWSVDAYSLCYKCHNSDTLFDGSVSGFEAHAQHVQVQNSPCFVCHDPHGSPSYVGLLNFDQNIVFPSGTGELRFEIIGNTGYCYLTCHGSDHDPKTYIRK